MLNHIVLFKFKAPRDKIERFYEGVKGLINVPGVVSVRAGEHNNNFYTGYSPRNAEYTHILLVTMKDQASIEVYDKSSLHDEIRKEFILPCVDKSASTPVLAVDFVSDDLSSKQLSCSNSTCNKSSCHFAIAGTIGIAAIAALVLAGKFCGCKK